MDNQNQQIQTPQSPNQMPSVDNNSSGSKIIPIGLGILFVLVAIGSYLLGTRNNQTVVSNQQNTSVPTLIPSPTPIDKTVSGKIYTIGDTSFALPEGWKLNKGEYSTQDDEYFSLHSPDIEYPFPEGSGIGAVIHIRREKTELTDTRCDPNEKISDEFERGITSDIKCIKINGKDIKKNHVDYEGHYLIYKFIHKGSTYTFNLQTSGVLKTEKKYLPYLESILNSINFGEN